MRLTIVAAAACLTLALQGGFAGAHANSTSTGGHCTAMNVTDYVASKALSQTTSAAWQNVPDAQMNFTTSATGCVIITFSGPAQINAPTGVYNVLYVRTLLDGNNLCVPAGYDDTFSEAQQPVPVIASSITRTCKNVAAGTHTLQVQFRSFAGVNAGTIFSSVLTVTHN